VFPSADLFGRVAIRDYVQDAEALGYAHVTLWEHVPGIDTALRLDWDGTNTLEAWTRTSTRSRAFARSSTPVVSTPIGFYRRT